ncbi:hypothetical protein [Leptospira santarosai]|uniref:ORC-CDC6 family AAA ATPase n=1 Tax=Leptospira santarosai TaxID=28183 RepID=UPI0024AEC69C|nr:hypothetical protein [Leptospira santarosai]MDI7191265.1 hypothetical protein [Leptospira santarosai]MDI7222749.1 hypothetical protein [Leptospira santarosai]
MKSFNILAQNRTEEIGYDLFERFVVPPFIQLVDPSHSSKPSVYTGGRGSGKTMLLRYYCHETQFSKNRTFREDEELSIVGLYWRMDSHYARSLFGRGISEDFWLNAFEHYAVLNISIEIFRAIDSIKKSNLQKSKIIDLEIQKFERLGTYLFLLNPNYNSTTVPNILYKSKQEFEIWLKNPKETSCPLLLPKSFLNDLISCLKENTSFFKNLIFHVFMDEYENLREYQQILINTWIKHCERDLIYNIALRPNGLKTNLTLSSERIIAIHDYRVHDLEEYTLKNNFKLFASEIFLNNLKLNNVKNIEIDENIMRDPNKIEERKSPEYEKNIESYMDNIFPTKTMMELATETISISKVEEKIENNIRKALTTGRISLEKWDLFLNPINPQIKIVLPYLLARKRTKIDFISKELQKAKKQEKNAFEGIGGWIDNIFLDCLLDLYEPYNRSCPVYSGFRKFEYLSHGNIRHFLELCFKCISQENIDLHSYPFTIDPITQATGIRSASEYLLNEIKGFGESGNRLSMFVHRLGHLYAVNRRRPEKSRSEVIQFSIASGSTGKEGRVFEFLNEACKYSILISSKGMQKFNQDDPYIEDFTLNPIYTPYFLLSYRRRKKIDLSTEDLNSLIFGTVDEFKKLILNFSRNFGFDEGSNLFDNIAF